MRTGPVVMVAEFDERGLGAMNRDLTACARSLATALSVPVCAVVLGARPQAAAETLARTSGINVTAVENPFLETYSAEVYLQELLPLMADWHPSVVVAGHGATGCDFAPALAAAMDAACITAVEAVEHRREETVFFRAVAGGKLSAGVRAASPAAVITVQPGAFSASPTLPPERTGAVAVISGSGCPHHSCSLGVAAAPAGASRLSEARVIVAAGNGIGDADNLDLVKGLAGLFSGSAVAGSRPVCDRGWLPYSCQVGITGKVVAPELYIACGISGTSQHAAGMSGSDLVVAINSDPHAAIFNDADIAIVEDLTTFIPILLDIHDKGGTVEGG